MHLDYTPEQRAFRDEMRRYFDRMMTPELQEEVRDSEGGGPLYTKALRQMGKDRLLGVGWPKEYGGQGRSPIEQFIFADEVQRAGFPLPFLSLNTVGPTLMNFGTDEQKDEFLPKIMRGECQFAIGYSEPEAGTDLASLKTRAVRDGDEYVINGSKVFTSLASFADFIWLAVRTDPDAPKHKGISIVMVPTTAPGYSLTPTQTMGGVRTNSTFYEDVRVPVRHRIGAENEGWMLITTQLNHERLALSSVGPVARLTREVTDWARATKLADGRRVIDREWVQVNLARIQAKIEVLKLMNWKQAWAMTKGALHPADSSVAKVFGSEFYVEAYRLLLEIVGQTGYLRDGSRESVLRGRLERMYRTTLILTFGGGTNEVQRDIIAMAGLQMPHYRK
jgi:alkylation response protein AidB-like acyl-CoA dehydrogenase